VVLDPEPVTFFAVSSCNRSISSFSNSMMCPQPRADQVIVVMLAQHRFRYIICRAGNSRLSTNPPSQRSVSVR